MQVRPLPVFGSTGEDLCSGAVIRGVDSAIGSSRIRIVPAELAHVYALAANMRQDDQREATELGSDPRRALRACFRGSLIRRTAFVDDAIAAMWGLAGVALADIGNPWLATTAAIERVPVSFVRQAKAELAAMLSLYPILENYVAADYVRAVRFLEVLGFALDAPAALGPRRAAFRRFRIERAPIGAGEG
jgi:hypothetical protein